MPFLYAFSFLLLVANICCFIKKKYLYLFLPCMLFLPPYYGFSISDSLPVISVTRIMFVIFYIYSWINRKRNLKIKSSNLSTIPKEYFLLFGYFLFRILSNLNYITTYSDATKTILSIVFEQILLIIAFYLLNPTRDEVYTLIKVLVWASTYLFVVGILESLTGFRLFDMLYTVSRDMYNTPTIRLGLLRSTTTMELPNIYGNFCIIVMPLILFLRHKANQYRYIIVLFLDLLAIIHSGCRSDILFYFVVLVAYVIIVQSKKIAMTSIKDLAVILVMVLLWCTALSASNEYYRYYYTGTGKSILNLVGFNFDLNANAPEGIDGYGKNYQNPTYSRTFQLSGITYALSVNPLSGLGEGCQNRGDIIYTFNGKQYHTHTIDTAFVEIPVSEGLLGVAGFICLFIGYTCIILKNKLIKSKDDLFKLYVVLFTAYILCMLSSINLNGYLTIITTAFYLKLQNSYRC